MTTVYKFIYCLTHDADIAEDLTQETFFQAIKGIDRFEGKCKISVWLCEIAKKLWYKELSKKKKHTSEELNENIASNEDVEGNYLQNLSKVERFDVFCCVMTLFIYFMITFGGFFLYSLLYCLMPRRMNCNYIIIHGAGLKKDGTVTPLLRQRIDKAIKVYKKCRNNPKFVPSGGQGGDEVISEAAAIRNYLLDKGIKDEDIVMEDKSTTTYENLKNVKEMLDEREKGRKYSCIFVTNNYHVLRTSFYAKKLKMRAQGVGAKTAGYFLPSAFIREYVAVMKMNKISLILLVCLLILEIKVI